MAYIYRAGDTWRDAATKSLDAMYERAAKAEARAERLREALTQIAQAKPSSGSDYSPNIIARDALALDEGALDEGDV